MTVATLSSLGEIAGMLHSGRVSNDVHGEVGLRGPSGVPRTESESIAAALLRSPSVSMPLLSPPFSLCRPDDAGGAAL